MKIATDFSGIGSPEMALKLLNIEHEQVFACEIDKYARKSFKAIHGNPQTFYKDITKRDHSEIPQLDLYVAGFPCQAFSMAGKRKGFDDVRGTLFFNVAEFIKINKPKCFILENVKGLLSHDGGKTFQTIISLLTDNGGTANGQIFIPYFEDGLGYHIYYKVLNTKDYGIPQNRERIFIIGFKEFREFSFPKPFPLELRLKDMLQDNPDYKYLMINSKNKKLNTFLRENGEKLNGIQAFDIHNKCIYNDYSPTICARINASSVTYLHIDDKYFLSDKMIENLEINQNNIHVPSATSKGYEESCNKAIVYVIPEQVKIRKYAVDILALQKCLKKHKKYTNKQIAEKLKVKKTTADHWFRTDTFFAVPDAEIWMQLKKLLEIETDEFDESIMTFIIQDGVFEKNNRVYDEIGIAPTLTKAASDEKILTNQYKIRRLTPLECFRLQGFPDDAFFRAEKVNSDTQLYKQAGNSITTCVMVELFKKIYI